VAGSPPSRVREEDPRQPALQLTRYFGQRQHLPGADRALDAQAVAVEVVIALEGLDQQVVQGNQIGPRQFEFPPNSPVFDSPGT